MAIFRCWSLASCVFRLFIVNASPAATDTTSRIRAAREAANLPGGRKAGLTEDELQRLENWQDDGFTPAERAAIRYARELTRTAHAQTAREEMFQHYTHEQMVEITLVVAMANFTNRFNNGLEILP